MIYTAQHVDAASIQTFDVLGPTVEVLTPPGPDDHSPALLRGTIPPGGVVPLHSHPDPETFVAVSGELDGLIEAIDGFAWVPISPGDVFLVPGGAKHAFRNRGPEPAVSIVLTMTKHARFFQEVGTPARPGDARTKPPSTETLARFFAVCERYGYWNAGAEENARIGIELAT